MHPANGGLFYSNQPPYRPSQDLAKLPLLCRKCDNTVLSALETQLREELDKNGYRVAVLQSDETLHRAMVSILWRFVTALRHWPESERGLTRFHFNPTRTWLQKGAATSASFEFYCQDALQEWGRYILGGPKPQRYPVHLVKHSKLQAAVFPGKGKAQGEKFSGLVNHSDILESGTMGWTAVVCVQTLGVFAYFGPRPPATTEMRTKVLERIELLHLEVLRLQRAVLKL